MQIQFRAGTNIHLGNMHYVLGILTHSTSFILSNCITHVISGKFLVCLFFQLCYRSKISHSFCIAEISYLPFSLKSWITQKGFILFFQRRPLWSYCEVHHICIPLPIFAQAGDASAALAVSKQEDEGFPEPKFRSICHLCPRYELEALQFCIPPFLWNRYGGCMGVCTCFSKSAGWITGKTKPEGAYSKS